MANLITEFINFLKDPKLGKRDPLEEAIIIGSGTLFVGAATTAAVIGGGMLYGAIKAAQEGKK